MINVCTQPTIEREPGGDFQVCFWVLDVFNYSTPFREMIADAVRALGRDPCEHVELPSYLEDEDFIEGAIILETARVRIYFEHARSYLSMAHPSASVLEEILEVLAPLIRITR